MAIISRIMMNLKEKAALENAEAASIKNTANIDYIAMMTDVEIPTEEEENGTLTEV